MKQPNRSSRILICTAAVLLMIVIGCWVYLADYYHADTKAIAAFSSDTTIVPQQISRAATAYIPEDAAAGFLFYPGGKVEHTAYEPLMTACAEQGILCVLFKMPGNLAVLGKNAADNIFSQFPDIENWYIGGHSLGGSMAASYASENPGKLKGLILLAAYSTEDLSSTSLNVLSVYGSEDRILNAENYKKYRTNLLENFTEIVIEGGCHAGFGMYGHQKGDGTPRISADTQIQIAANEISEFLLGSK